MNQENSPASIGLADILWRYLKDYHRRYKLHPDHFDVVSDIMKCRTPYLGGHIYRCDDCDQEVLLYNSCRNRHCPKCQTMTKAKWLEDRKAELLPVTYFHTVFTLPHEINPVALCNKRKIYGMLFTAVSQTLLTFGKNPENGLGGKLGLIAILHTWNQKLEDHIHLHGVVPGGVLSFDQKRFIRCKGDFLFSVESLSKVFRGKFMELFQAAYDEGELIFPGKTELLGTPNGFKTLKRNLWKKDWVVYAKKPFDGPKDVLSYIARYTHRVAISNNRIMSCENGHVTFSYRNREKSTVENQTLEASEFIRRFLLHVVPKGFMRIRHYGLFANRSRKKNLNACRQLLGVQGDAIKPAKKSIEDLMMELTGKDIRLCPYCQKGTLKQSDPILRDTRPDVHNIINQVKWEDSS